MGYINNDKDFRQIKDPSYQSKIATDIVNGLNAYFKAGNHQWWTKKGPDIEFTTSMQDLF